MANTYDTSDLRKGLKIMIDGAPYIVVEAQFVAKEQREYEFLQLSAEERYRLVCEQFPSLVQHIPQHQIASYIGITPVALSRIRGRRRR